MTTREPSGLRTSLHLLRARFVAEQTGFALLVLLLSILWLRIPDSSIFALAVSFVFGLAILALVGSGEAVLILRLCAQSVTMRRLLRGGAIVLLAVALWCGWRALMRLGAVHDALWSGYINSQLRRSTRHLFSQPHLLLWFDWSWTLLTWIGGGLLVALAVSHIASARPARVCMRAFRSAAFWVAWFAAAVLAPLITNSLLAWVPGRGLGIELISLVLRLVVVVVVDGCAFTFLLAVMAMFVREIETS